MTAADAGQEIRVLIERWAHAVRSEDLDGVLAGHAQDIVLFDVPPPVRSVGIDAYRRAWDGFFDWARKSGAFDIVDLSISAGEDVAFSHCLIRCAGETDGRRSELTVRLTIGLRRIRERWTIVHEHHSVPAQA